MRKQRLVVLAVGVICALSCSGSEPFDAAAVDLAGEWLVSDVTRPQGGTTPGGFTNECRLRDVPFTVITTDTPGVWSALQEEGGTLACELNGEWGQPVPPPERLGFALFKDGNAVQWVLASRYSYYVGTLTSERQMGGAVDSEGYGREGTWSARRR
jgi:hypothetical protein